MSPDKPSEEKTGGDKPKPGDDKPGRKTYVGYMFSPRGHKRIEPHALEVRGAVTWAVRRPGQQSMDQLMAAWDERGYKMGLLVMRNQRIDYIAYAGLDRPPVVLEPAGALIPDLNSALGTPPGYEWLGFLSKGRRKFALIEPNVVEFDLTLHITPAQRGPQIVPVASRHLDGTFVQSYMPGLWVLPGAGG